MKPSNRKIDQIETLMEKQKKLDVNILRKEKQDLENILSGIDSRGEEVINTRW